MKIILTNINVLLVLKLTRGAIDGVSYMDQMISGKSNPLPKGEDPCNPLYWYPQNIPEHCQHKKVVTPNKPDNVPIPMPIPIPYLPPPVIPSIPPAPPPPIIQPPLPPPMYPPPIYQPPLPLTPTHPMMPPYVVPYPPMPPPIPNIPPLYPYPSFPNTYPQQVGMMPGIPGIVTSDGGINILPFSDVYSDLLQKRKQKIIQRKLQRVLEDYEDYPRSRHFRVRKRLSNIYY